ncbi:uncharacterized protein [Littorina saxatilis]
MCDNHCQCPSGYECYRQVTGVCCAPRTCITVAQANANRDYWRCRPYPPAPPPENNNGDNGQMQKSFKSPEFNDTTTTQAPTGEENAGARRSFKKPVPNPTTTTEEPRMMNSFKKMGPPSGEEANGRRSLFRSLCPQLPGGAVPQAPGGVLP